jgi:hypothetical protein
MEYLQGDKLMQSAIYKTLMTKGRQEGRQEGHQERAAAMLIRLLQKRFGNLDPAIAARVESQSDLAILDAWYDEALEIIDAQAAAALADRILKTPV